MKRLYSLLTVLAAFVVGTTAYSQTTFIYSGVMETYTVPAGVSMIQIETHGAQGGYVTGGGEDGGLGAIMIGDFAVTPGQVLEIIVGGQGAENSTSGNQGGAGGGGTFVVDQSTGTPLIVSGGGGGGCLSGAYASYTTPYDASVTNAQLGTDGATTSGGAGGGTAGGGAAAGETDCCLTGGFGGSGGGGMYGDGSDGSPGTWGMPSEGGKAFVNGGAGGVCGSSTASYPVSGSGGFGGGGGSAMDNAFRAGGGGGYSGGQGAVYISGSGYLYGGGGGSFNSGTSPSNSIGATGDGMVIITELCNGLITSVSDDTVCVGDAVTLSATSSGTGTVTWDGGVVDGTPFTPPAGSTTYTATSSDPSDCAFVITVFVGDFPTVDAGPDQDVCEGDSTMVSGSGTATDWSWDGGVTDGVNFLPPSGTTTYTVTGTIDSTGCQATDMMDVTVVVPDVSITATGTDLIANQAGATYQWLDCPALTPIAGETSQTFTPSADGNYAVAVTISGCTDTSACQQVMVGIEELSKDLKVYPNPTDGLVTISMNGNFQYSVMNLVGEVVLNGRGTDQKNLSLEKMATGAYFLKVISDGDEKTIKIIKR